MEKSTLRPYSDILLLLTSIHQKWNSGTLIAIDQVGSGSILEVLRVGGWVPVRYDRGDERVGGRVVEAFVDCGYQCLGEACVQLGGMIHFVYCL